MKNLTYMWIKSALILSLIHGFVPGQATCPTSSTINNGTHTITTADGSCAAITGNVIVSTANITIQNGGTLTLTVSTRFAKNGGSITVESGGSLVVNGTGGALGLRNGATLTVNSGGTVNISGGFNIGNPAGSQNGNLVLNGSLTVGGNLNLNNMGVMSGSGTATVTGDINDNGGDDSGFSGSESCGGNCDPLPVELISFNGQTLTNQSIALAWETASELNNEGFYIERSTNGSDFLSIDFVSGHGTSNEHHQYNYIDDQPLDAVQYYRLKQVDYDGQFEYSATIMIHGATSPEISIYPNPSADYVRLSGTAKDLFDLRVINISGQLQLEVMHASIAELESTLNQALPRLTDSQYILQLNSAHGSVTKRLGRL